MARVATPEERVLAESHGRQPGSRTVLEVLNTERPDWFEHAACRGKTRLFFGPDGYENSHHQRLRELEAVAVCNRCPVREPCRQLAHANREQGVWGGETDIERARAGRAAPESTIRSRLAREQREAEGER